MKTFAFQIAPIASSSPKPPGTAGLGLLAEYQRLPSTGEASMTSILVSGREQIKPAPWPPPAVVAAAGVPGSASAKKLALRIGAHSDALWHLDRWQRCPEICREFTIEKPYTRAASAFGGLIYIVVPRGSSLGNVAVTIAGAVETPLFVRGRTDAAECRTAIRGRPAPWAELATGKVIITLPSKAVRGVEDPEGLLAYWDQVLDACADLAGRPARRERPERFVTDVQIAAGYMHSGYPLMTLLDMPEVMVDERRIKANGHGGVWGLFHELGHNHQSADWTSQSSEGFPARRIASVFPGSGTGGRGRPDSLAARSNSGRIWRRSSSSRAAVSRVRERRCSRRAFRFAAPKASGVSIMPASMPFILP